MVASWVSSGFASSSTSRRFAGCFPQSDRHRRSGSKHAFDPDFPAPAVDDLTADRQSEATPAGSRRKVRLEHARQDVRGDPVAVIANPYRHLRGGLDLQRYVFRVREPRVLEKVEQDFLQLVAAGHRVD